MRILKQMMVIGTVTFAGELCNLLLPLPVPASVYGMLLLFLCLQTGVLKLSQVEDTADFLVAIMPVMFVAPCVSLMDSVPGVMDSIPELALISLLTTVTTMSMTGVIAQWMIRRRCSLEGANQDKNNAEINKMDKNVAGNDEEKNGKIRKGNAA